MFVNDIVTNIGSTVAKQSVLKLVGIGFIPQYWFHPELVFKGSLGWCMATTRCSLLLVTGF